MKIRSQYKKLKVCPNWEARRFPKKKKKKKNQNNIKVNSVLSLDIHYDISTTEIITC
jgi:hypothetical protein